MAEWICQRCVYPVSYLLCATRYCHLTLSRVCLWPLYRLRIQTCIIIPDELSFRLWSASQVNSVNITVLSLSLVITALFVTMMPRQRLQNVLSGNFSFHLFHDFLTVLSFLSVSIVLSIPSSVHLGFLSRFLICGEVTVKSTDALPLSLRVCHLRARKTIGSNLVSLSCCLGEWVSRANQQLYLWPAEENLGDPISCTNTHDRTPAHKTHAKVHHSRTTLPDMVSHTHTHWHSWLCVCCFYFWHRQVQLCTGVHMQTHTYVVMSIHPNTCAKVRHRNT